MDLLALENKLSRAQRQLGALVYALHKNGEENTALVERYIETVSYTHLDVYKRQRIRHLPQDVYAEPHV